MGTAEEVRWDGSGEVDSSDPGELGTEGAATIGLGFTAEDIVDAALVQEEVIDFSARAARMRAGERHFTKDPRDLDPRDLPAIEELSEFGEAL